MNWTLEQWVIFGTWFLSLLGSGLSIYNTWNGRKLLNAQTHREDAAGKNEDAQASETYAKASQMVAEELVKVRAEQAELRNVLDERDQLIFKLQGDNADLQNWAERLVHQIQSLGAEPVPFRSSRTKPLPKKD